jgi:hypothetical protein
VQRAPIFAFYSLPTRAFELGCGALLAIFIFRTQAAWFGIALIAAGASLYNSQTVFPALPALLPIIGAVAILTSTVSNPLLRNQIAQKVGDWSYSIYLWHWPLLVIPTLYLQRALTNCEKLLAITICFGLAALTYRYVENPLRKAHLSGSVVLAGALAGGLLLSGSAYALQRGSTETSIAQPQIYSDGCQLDKQAIAPKASCLYGDKKSDKSVVLFGDSHAAQWFPALNIWAKARRYKLVVMTKSSCPALPLPLKDNGAFKAKNCNQFRVNALKAIAKLNPSLVIAGNFEHYVGISQEDYAKNPNFNFKYLLLRDTPWPNRDIPTCLTTHASCDSKLPIEIPYSTKNIFNPIPLLCNSKCPAVVDGLMAYRDQTHISVAMAEHLEGALARQLDALVAG